MAVRERKKERGGGGGRKKRERGGEEEIAGAAGDKFPRNKPASAKENKVSTRARILVRRSVSQHAVLRARQVFDLVPVEIRHESYPRRGNSSFFFRRFYPSLVKLDRKKLDCGISRKGGVSLKLNWAEFGRKEK